MLKSPIMKITGRGLFARLSFCLVLIASPALADQVYLDDGSRLVGDVLDLRDQILVIDTAFAGRMEIDAARVSGIDLDDKALVTLNSGDRLNGILRYSPEDGQRVTGTLLGDIALSEDLYLVAITDADKDAAAAAQPGEVRKLKRGGPPTTIA
ncbi:MAG: hypothetical protein WD750_05275 [Gammaproteobacteria bacterium]